MASFDNCYNSGKSKESGNEFIDRSAFLYKVIPTGMTKIYSVFQRF